MPPVGDELASLPEVREGAPFSLEELAARTGRARDELSAALRSLEEKGYVFEPCSGGRLRLSPRSDILTAESVGRLLAPEARGLRLEVLDLTDSTNRVVRLRAREGEPEGLAVIAAAQTGGRGRFERPFYSPARTGLYLSLLLRPSLPADRALLITCAAAVAVCETAEAFGLSPGIKWVNDVLIDGRKVCGILTEASLAPGSDRLDHAVLGVGINVAPPPGGFPAELRDIAGAMLPTSEGNGRARVCALFLSSFMRLYSGAEDDRLTEAYRARSLVPGRRITVLKESGPVEALALDIDGRCRLRVRYDGGREELLSSGEISIRLNGDR